MDCGFRESGLSLGQKKIMLAIRTTSNSLELPLCVQNELIVSEEKIAVLIDEANKRLRSNFYRINKLLDMMKEIWQWPRFYSVSPISNINRWGHSLCEIETKEGLSSILLIGGYGLENESNKSSRSIKSVTISVDNSVSSRDHEDESMHACTAVFAAQVHDIVVDFVLISGGRKSPTQSLPCLREIMRIDTMEIIHFESVGVMPAPRWGHSLSKISGNQYLLIGGRDKDAVYNDCNVLTISVKQHSDVASEAQCTIICEWEELVVSIPKIFFHASSVIPFYYHDNECGTAVICHGGLSSIDDLSSSEYSNLFVIIPSRRRCYAIDVSSTMTTRMLATSRFGHTMTYLGLNTLIFCGGTSFSADPCDDCRMFVVNIGFEGTESQIIVESVTDSRKLLYNNEIVFPCENCRCHHQTYFNESLNRICCVGGGSQCLAFGPHYCESLTLSIAYGANRLSDADHREDSSHTTTNHKDVVPQVASKSLKEESSPAILVPKKLVKTIKNYLEENEFYDKSRRIAPSDESSFQNTKLLSLVDGHDDLHYQSSDLPEEWTPTFTNVMAVPITNSFCTILMSPNHATHSEVARMINAVLSSSNSEENDPRKLFLYFNGSTAMSKVKIIDHYRQATEYLQNFIDKNNISSTAKDYLPNKYEFVGDVLMIPEDSFTHSSWNNILHNPSSSITISFLHGLADIFGVSRVARKARIDTGPKRESHVIILYPVASEAVDMNTPITKRPGWVEVSENKIIFGFDITKVMFCSGNVTERMRMGSMKVKDEIIVDLYCGIGYYTLPFLVHGQAAHVFACEWNINSVDALKHNMKRMKVENKCTVFYGDNRETVNNNPNLWKIADRVSLGLLPSSTMGWPLAVNVLKSSGGMIHVHENVMESNINEFVIDCCNQFKSLFANEHQKEYQVECLHLERVKSYAPRVYHIVLDLKCTPVDVTESIIWKILNRSNQY